VLLVVIDTLRADHIGCYGYEAISTPTLDRLAREGTLYENAMTAVPLTLPSVATMLTGAYPLQHGVRDNGPFRLADGWETLAERFHETGFRTGAFVSAHVLANEHGLEQGFEIYDDDLAERYETHHPMMRGMEDRLQGIERRGEKTIDRALEWMRAEPGRDAFVMVHLFDPHLPRDPTPEFRDRYPEQLYDGEIASVDHQIGRLLEGARERWDDSQIVTVVVGDHGEGLFDHEEEFHGVLLFNETMRVPLIFHGPGIERGLRVREVARTIDIAPTICALTSMTPLPRSSGAVLPGISAASGDRSSLAHVAYMETLRPRLSHGWCELRGVRIEDWKLIEGPTVELYDLASDPRERTNLADGRPAIRDSLLALMDAAAWRSLGAGRDPATFSASTREDRERLLSLGYVSPAEAPSSLSDSAAIWGFPAHRRGVELGMADPRERLVGHTNRATARSLVMSAKEALRSGHLPAAEESFRAALHYHAESIDAHLGLAEVLERTGRFADALKILVGAEDLAPDDPRVLAARKELVGRHDSLRGRGDGG